MIALRTTNDDKRLRKLRAVLGCFEDQLPREFGGRYNFTSTPI